MPDQLVYLAMAVVGVGGGLAILIAAWVAEGRRLWRARMRCRWYRLCDYDIFWHSLEYQARAWNETIDLIRRDLKRSVAKLAERVRSAG